MELCARCTCTHNALYMKPVKIVPTETKLESCVCESENNPLQFCGAFCIFVSSVVCWLGKQSIMCVLHTGTVSTVLAKVQGTCKRVVDFVGAELNRNEVGFWALRG